MRWLVFFLAAVVALAGVMPVDAAVCRDGRCPAPREGAAKAAVKVTTAGGSGTGVVAYMYGQPMVLTAAHVPAYSSTTRTGLLRTSIVKRVAQTATISDGTISREAVLLGVDHDADVAMFGCKQIFDLDIAIAEIRTDMPKAGAEVTSYGYGIRDGIEGLSCNRGRLTSTGPRWLINRTPAHDGDSGGPMFDEDGYLIGLVVRGDDGEPKSIAMTMTAISIAIKAWPYVKQVLSWVADFRKWRMEHFGADGYDRPILARLVRGRKVEPEPEPEPVIAAVPIMEPEPIFPPSNLKPQVTIHPEPEQTVIVTVTPEPVIEPEAAEQSGPSTWLIAIGPSLMALISLTFFGVVISGTFLNQKR